MTALILARAKALALLTDIHKAKKSHKATKALRKRLVRVRAEVARAE